MSYLGREAAKAPLVTADLPNDGVTLAKMTGGTDGQIITYDASGDPVAVGPGTDGQVLTSTGAGSPPAFEDAAGGTAAILNAELLYRHPISGTNLLTTSSSFVDSGVAGSFDTVASSSDSYLLLEIWSSMIHHGADDVVGQIDCTLRTSSSTSHADADSLTENASNHWYLFAGVASHVGRLGRFTYNTVNSEYYPSNLASYSAGDTLYFRFFFKSNGNSLYLYHGNSMLDIHLWEISK